MMKILTKIINRLLSIKNKIIKIYLNTFIWRNKKYKIDLNALFKDLNNYKYALIKVDTPYTPNDFPKQYPIGKDLDIFCVKESFHDINRVLNNFANSYNDIFDIKIIDEKGKYRVRLEKYGQLYYLLDNNYLTDNNLSSVFINKSIENKIMVKNYYTIEKKYEILFRLSEIKNNPNKKHHIDYILQNISSVDKKLIKQCKLDKIFNKIVEK